MSARVLLVLASGRRRGLGHRLADVARAALLRAGADVRVHDLLADGFDPVLRLADDQPIALPVTEGEDALCARYQADARWAEAFVVVHPIWWFAPPALLKGWVDRVLVEDVALAQQPTGPPKGLLGGKRLLVVQTFQTNRALDRLAFGGIAGFFWKRVVGLPTGMERVTRLPLYGVQELAPRRLERFERRLERAAAGLVEGVG